MRLAKIRFRIEQDYRELKDALAANLAGLARYPATVGLPEFREVLAAWIVRRYGLDSLDPAREVIPVGGSREALFSIAQAVLDPTWVMFEVDDVWIVGGGLDDGGKFRHLRYIAEKPRSLGK